MREIYNFMVSLYGSSSKDDLEMDETSIGLLKKDDKYDKNEKKSITREFKQQKWQYSYHSLRPDSLDANGHYISQGRAEISPGDGVNLLRALPNNLFEIITSFNHPDDNVQLAATSTQNYGKDPQLVSFRHTREHAHEAAQLCVPVSVRNGWCPSYHSLWGEINYCPDIEICLPDESIFEVDMRRSEMNAIFYRNIRIDLAHPRDMCREADAEIFSQHPNYYQISCSLIRTLLCLPMLCTFCSPCIAMQCCLRCCGAMLGSIEDCKSKGRDRHIKDRRNQDRINQDVSSNIAIERFRRRIPSEPTVQIMSDNPSSLPNSVYGYNQYSSLRSYMQYPGIKNNIIQNHIAERYKLGKNGFPKDRRKAVHWYKQAATNGHEQAQILLGFWCENGKDGLIRDPLKAIYWYQLAALQGSKDAQKRLGRLIKKNQRESKLSANSTIPSPLGLLRPSSNNPSALAKNISKTTDSLGMK